jgi:hypothetical protein
LNAEDAEESGNLKKRRALTRRILFNTPLRGTPRTQRVIFRGAVSKAIAQLDILEKSRHPHLVTGTSSPLIATSNQMPAHPPRRRLKFSEVALGERFYDPVSAEYFVKQSDNLAAMVTGIGDGSIPDEFEADDIVGIDLN